MNVGFQDLQSFQVARSWPQIAPHTHAQICSPECTGGTLFRLLESSPCAAPRSPVAVQGSSSLPVSQSCLPNSEVKPAPPGLPPLCLGLETLSQKQAVPAVSGLAAFVSVFHRSLPFVTWCATPLKLVSFGCFQ